MVTFSFNPETDIPDLSGKVIVITGATSGIGRVAARAFAKHNPAFIWLSGRSASRADAVIAELNAISPTTRTAFLPCDLSSLSSVAAAADTVLAGPANSTPRLDILMCNAGVATLPTGLSADGYEVQFATNHLGHALLIRKLLPLVEKAPDPRVVVLTSLAFNMAGGIPFDKLRTTQSMMFGKWRRYGQSKLANLLYSRELAKRYPNVTVVCVHPGVVMTEMVATMSWINWAIVQVTTFWYQLTLEQGAYNQLWASVVPKDQVTSGAFYEPVGKSSTPQTATAKHDGLALKLWEWTEKELEKYLAGGADTRL
ncbi:oxidoreductase [Trichodelitschia bisporula]|uniref:Oxidoreductase n=1 Tax=Trichodelitschia bisporula TaxID=703511 RepID=A0A6G1HNH5_9PEZI|nr:oxidoreductase [Trichodelitschia bisporula]